MRVSRHWLPAEVARRLLARATPKVVAARVLARRDRQLDYTPTRDQRYVWWDAVLVAIAKRCCVSLHPRIKARSELALGIETCELRAGDGPIEREDDRCAEPGWYWRFRSAGLAGHWCGPFESYGRALYDAALQDADWRGLDRPPAPVAA